MLLFSDEVENRHSPPRNPWFFGVLILIVLSLGLIMQEQFDRPQLLTDPFLLFPTPNSVRVVWFTEFTGTRHTVACVENLERIVTANTTKLNRTREDKD